MLKLTEKDIKLAIKNYCFIWIGGDQKLELNDIQLKSEIDDESQTQLFSATVIPTKCNSSK